MDRPQFGREGAGKKEKKSACVGAAFWEAFAVRTTMVEDDGAER